MTHRREVGLNELSSVKRATIDMGVKSVKALLLAGIEVPK